LTDALKFVTTFYRKYPTSGYLGDVKKFEEQTKQEFAAHSKMKQEIADRKAAVVTGSDSSSN
jgi:outer membrane protein assembly factor BamD